MKKKTPVSNKCSTSVKCLDCWRKATTYVDDIPFCKLHGRKVALITGKDLLNGLKEQLARIDPHTEENRST